MFNRGFRRDDRNSFRSNANMSRGHNAPSLMSVSPWEGGIVPGSGGSSILGSPQLQGNQGVLTPQAQVLAQNLSILSNLGLLQPQIQARQTQSLPSLINLGSALNRSLGMGHQNSGYQNRGPVNRYQDQRPKYVRQDVRRSDSFNKNRPRPSQSQSSQQKLQSYRPLNSKITPPSSARKQGSQGGDSLAKARADVRGKRAKKESTKSDSEDAEVDEDAKKEEGEEVVKKRDWKKEKKTDLNEVDDDNEEKEKAASDVAVLEDDGDKSNGVGASKDEGKVKEGEEKEISTESKEKDGDKDAKSAESSTYNCHVCSKALPDTGALSSHLRTASHKRMMNQLEETYAIKVKRIRDQMRSNETQKEEEMNVRGRGRRANMQRGHCKMCDLTFMGNITAHRKTPLHVKLKNFLHPNCAPCGKEFPARMEWDQHKLTVDHLRIVAGIDRRLKKLMGTASNRNEPNYAKLVPKFPEGLDSDIANMDEEMADRAAADTEGKEEGTMTYDPAVVTGINMLVHGQHCGVCKKFFARRPDALEHCKTRTHFDNHLQMKAKVKAAAEEAARLEAEAKEKAAADAEAEAKAKADAEATEAADISTESEKPTTEEAEDKEKEDVAAITMKTPVVCLKRAVARKDEGNWKRSRTNKNEDDEDDGDEEDEETPEVLDDMGDDEATNKVPDDSDKYDPLQPTSPAHSNETHSQDTTVAGDNDNENMDTADIGKEASVADEENPVAKPANKARRGRKRK